MHIMERLLGALVLLVALADVFLTILYARIRSGFLAMPFARVLERIWAWLSPAFGRLRGRFLTLCGPLTLLGVLGLWTGMLVLGSALVVHPALGQSVRPSSGEASTDFVTALYVGGASISVVGSSGYTPTTQAYRLFFLFDSFVGTTLISLVLTFLGQLYTALLRRNALALRIHALTDEKGDGANLVCRLWPRNDLSSSMLDDLATEMTAVKEAHHFYPLLVQFRFEEAFYSVSRMANVSLDALSLAISSLDDERFAATKESAGVALLWRSSSWIAEAVIDASAARARSTAHDVDAWRTRFRAARARFTSAHIAIVPDEERAFQRYADLRARWDRWVHVQAPALTSSTGDVDPPLAKAAARGASP